MDDYALYGFSIFETLLASHGRFWRLPAHHRRLTTAADHFGLDAPNFDAFCEALKHAHDPGGDEVLRVTLLREGGRWSAKHRRTRLAVWARTLEPGAQKTLTLTRATASISEHDPLRAYKCGARIAYQAAYDRARTAGCDDVVFYDHAERVLETSTCNLCFFIDGVWVTPAASLGLLPGIVRAWLLERTRVREAAPTLHDLASATAAIATNAVRGLTPIGTLDDLVFDPEPAEALIESLGPRRFEPISRVR